MNAHELGALGNCRQFEYLRIKVREGRELKGEAERRSINTPVQGSGSDILLSAAIQVKKELEPYGLKIVGTVHDSILGEFPEEYQDWFVEQIKRIMIHPKLLDEFGVELRCPLDCDIGVGPWGTH